MYKSSNVPLALVGLVGASSIVMNYVGFRLRTKLLSHQRRAWKVANRYHVVHTFALAAVVGLMSLAQTSPEALSRLNKGFYLILIGAGGFATSIYSLVLRWWPKLMGPVTPTSGLVLVLGWVNVGLAGLYW